MTNTTGAIHKSGVATRVEYRMTEGEKKNLERLEHQVKTLEKDAKERKEKHEKVEEKYEEVKEELEALQKMLEPEAITALVSECEQLKATTSADLQEKSDELEKVKKESQAIIEDLTARLTDMTREAMRQEALIRSNVEEVEERVALNVEEVQAESVDTY